MFVKAQSKIMYGTFNSSVTVFICKIQDFFTELFLSHVTSFEGPKVMKNEESYSQRRNATGPNGFHKITENVP